MIILTILNCNTCSITGDRSAMLQLYNQFKIKHPEAFHIRTRMRGSWWDGNVEYINKSGIFRIGLLPKVYEAAKNMGEKVKIVDTRPELNVKPKVPKYIGEFTLKPKQIKALETLLNNKVGGVPFLICAGDYSVSFGKTLIFAGIHESFKRKLKTILLLNDSDLFEQFKDEIPKLLPDEDITFVRGGKVNEWGNFVVAMVPSLAQNLKVYQQYLTDFDICLIDEADIIDNKTYKSVIEHLYNTTVRIGLSGTLYMSELKKKIIHNMNIMQFIGPKVDEVRIKEIMESGDATKVAVKMIVADYEVPEYSMSYQEEFEELVVKNKNAKKISLIRTKYNIKYGRLPVVIVTKYIEQCESLYKYYQKKLGDKYKIAYVHHNVKERTQIFKDFRNGEIDILISTLIIKRGKNLPSIKYLQNAASGASNETTIQVLGRLVRLHVDKEKGFLDDIVYPGKYLRRHGRARKRYYNKEKLQVTTVDYE